MSEAKPDLREPMFAYVGRWPCGKHAFKADLGGISSFRAYEFERRIADWSLNQAEGPSAVARPAIKTSTAASVVVLIERVVDVIRFDQEFRVSGLKLDDLG